MELAEFEAVLSQTLEDLNLSRSERRAVSALLAEASLDADALALFRSRAFDMARERAHDPRDRDLLDWLEDVVKLLVPTTAGSSAPRHDACFSPGDDCRNRIRGLLASTRGKADICVFTITDDTISREIALAHSRGVRVRILTDDDKSQDLGSDIEGLRRAGIPVAVDQSEKHMHHKFAIFDARTLVTGSYNWTRSAATDNEENIVVTEEPSLVRVFEREFDRLWSQFA